MNKYYTKIGIIEYQNYIFKYLMLISNNSFFYRNTHNLFFDYNIILNDTFWIAIVE